MQTTKTIFYERESSVDAESVANIYKLSGLNRPHQDIARIQKMLDNSNLIVTARVGTVLVGIARSVTDWSYCCYLSDLAVDPAFQGRGVGQGLIRETKHHVGDAVKIILLAAPTAKTFYAHVADSLGLQVELVNSTWVIPRKA